MFSLVELYGIVPDDHCRLRSPAMAAFRLPRCPPADQETPVLKSSRVSWHRKLCHPTSSTDTCFLFCCWPSPSCETMPVPAKSVCKTLTGSSSHNNNNNNNNNRPPLSLQVLELGGSGFHLWEESLAGSYALFELLNRGTSQDFGTCRHWTRDAFVAMVWVNSRMHVLEVAVKSAWGSAARQPLYARRRICEPFLGFETGPVDHQSTTILRFSSRTFSSFAAAFSAATAAFDASVAAFGAAQA